MLADNNSEYYAAREKVALRLAANAVDPAIAKIHRSMAEEYRERSAFKGNVIPLRQVSG